MMIFQCSIQIWRAMNNPEILKQSRNFGTKLKLQMLSFSRRQSIITVYRLH